MSHPCHDPFCTIEPRRVRHRGRDINQRLNTGYYRGPFCTAAVQVSNKSIKGIRPWVRCALPVGAHGDRRPEQMRCAKHKVGGPYQNAPNFKEVLTWKG